MVSVTKVFFKYRFNLLLNCPVKNCCLPASYKRLSADESVVESWSLSSSTVAESIAPDE